MKKVVIIVPVFNEEEALEPFYARLSPLLAQWPYEFKLLFVDDGSTDNTLALLCDLAQYPIPNTQYPIPNTQYPIPR